MTIPAQTAGITLPCTDREKAAFGRLICRLGARAFDEHIIVSVNCFPDDAVTVETGTWGLESAHKQHGVEDGGDMGRKRAEFGWIEDADATAALERLVAALPQRSLDSRLPRTVAEQERIGAQLVDFMRGALDRGLGFGFTMAFPPLADPVFSAQLYAPQGVRPSHRHVSAGTIPAALEDIGRKLEESYPRETS